VVHRRIDAVLYSLNGSIRRLGIEQQLSELLLELSKSNIEPCAGKPGSDKLASR